MNEANSPVNSHGGILTNLILQSIASRSFDLLWVDRSTKAAPQGCGNDVPQIARSKRGLTFLVCRLRTRLDSRQGCTADARTFSGVVKGLSPRRTALIFSTASRRSRKFLRSLYYVAA